MYLSTFAYFLHKSKIMILSCDMCQQKQDFGRRLFFTVLIILQGMVVEDIKRIFFSDSLVEKSSNIFIF